MKVFEVLTRIFSSAWGAWAVAAFGMGIFFWIVSAALKKARLSTIGTRDSYRFFRLLMILAFLLAIAGLITATAREFLQGFVPSKQERIEKLARDLKNDDPTVRRQAADSLVTFGGDAAKELVRVMSEEAGVVAAEMMGRATSGDLSDVLTGFLGAPPWKTPFMSAATDCLVRIRQPSVPHILNQLSEASLQAERIMAEAAKRQSPRSQDAERNFQQWGFMLGAAGQSLRIGIEREVFSNALVEIGEAAAFDLVGALQSPRLLVRMTAYQVLGRSLSVPPTAMTRLRKLAETSTDQNERKQLLALIRQLETGGR